MALDLDKPLDCGVTASYHRILRYAVDLAPQAANPGVTGPLVTVTVGEYANEAARRSGALPIRHEHFTWMVLPSDLSGDLRPVLYVLLQEKHYAGAAEA